MLPKLSQSERFISDTQKWKNNIDKIQDETYKNFVLIHYNKFISLAKEVDDAHDSRNNGNIKPYMIRDKLEEMGKIRKNMPKYFNDYFSTQQQSS